MLLSVDVEALAPDTKVPADLKLRNSLCFFDGGARIFGSTERVCTLRRTPRPRIYTMKLYPTEFVSLLLTLFAACSTAGVARRVHSDIEHDAPNKRIIISDDSKNIILRIRYDGCCMIDRLRVGGEDVVRADTGVCGAISVGGAWFSTREGIPDPKVNIMDNSATLTGIRYGGGGVNVTENWIFTLQGGAIVWRIDREYLTKGSVDDMYFPGFDFKDMSTWTGALLGFGGVAWCKLFDAPGASYGVHNGNITFWNRDRRRCLRIDASAPAGESVAVRFSRQPSGVWSFNYSASESELKTKYGLTRFLHDRQDVFAPVAVAPSKVSIQLTLSAPDSDTLFDRGDLKGIDGRAVRDLCNTIARIGAVDEHIIGSNGYYSDFAVLHEPWISQLGLVIGDDGYFRAMAEMIDFQRERAVGKDGRVKSRWSGRPADDVPGTYDANGYYECQWGQLMDSQTSFAINAAELFEFTNDRAWLVRQKPACEGAIDYLLSRDKDGDGLVEMATDSCKQGKSSDWIDVVWASHENALVNAQLYEALTHWSALENLLGDGSRADNYKKAAAKLKMQFNKNAADGGFWDPENQCYDYWRDADGSMHGRNCVIPVQFSAIGYGLCDDPARAAAILNKIESAMTKESLFFWPLCLTSFAPGESVAFQYPFPNYENGDIFFAWGELGTRAYAAREPALAVKYIKNLLARYAMDGLAYQRVLRSSQKGEGNDILSNNCSAIVGLYRNIYGIQPRHDALYLNPRPTPELYGTVVRYRLRGREYKIQYSKDSTSVECGDIFVNAPGAFAVDPETHRVHYYLDADVGQSIRFREGRRGAGSNVSIQNTVHGCAAGASYQLVTKGGSTPAIQADAAGEASFVVEFNDAETKTFEIRRAK